jgi:DNA-binding beta-propeller fold protein YncE
MRTPGGWVLAAFALVLLAGCRPPPDRPGVTAGPAAATHPPGAPSAAPRLPGMPPPLRPGDVYAADRPGRLSPVVRHMPARVWVPDSTDGTVHVIDARTRRVVRRFRVGRLPQHVTPSWDLRRLWVANDESNTLTPIDPATGHVGRPVPVADPYNLYFTPNGRRAIVVAERLGRLDFREPRSMRLRHALPVPCPGVDHLDFSADGRYLLASCEFGASLIRVDVATERVTGTWPCGRAPSPRTSSSPPTADCFT